MKQDDEGKLPLNTEQIRAGETSGHVRAVLIVGLILAVAGLGVVCAIWA